MSSTSSLPFLAAISHLRLGPNVALAVLSSVLAAPLVYKMFMVRLYRFAHIMVTSLSLIRIGTYTTRAIVSRADPARNSYRGLVIAASVLLIAGFLFLLEGILSLVIHWVLHVRRITLGRRNLFRTHWVAHFFILVFTALSIGGSLIQIFQYDAPDPSTGAVDLGKKLRVISGALFIALVVITLIFIGIFGLVSHIAYEKARREGRDPTTSPRHPSWIMVLFLALLTVLTLPEAIYRCLSSEDTTGFIVTDSAVGVLVFLPEALIFIIFTLVDFSDLSQLSTFWSQDRKGKTGDRAVPHYDAAKIGQGRGEETVNQAV